MTALRPPNAERQKPEGAAPPPSDSPATSPRCIAAATDPPPVSGSPFLWLVRVTAHAVASTTVNATEKTMAMSLFKDERGKDLD